MIIYLILAIVTCLISIGVIVIITMQEPKEGGLSSSITGSASGLFSYGTAYRARSRQEKLVILTGVLVALFILVAVVMVVLARLR